MVLHSMLLSCSSSRPSDGHMAAALRVLLLVAVVLCSSCLQRGSWAQFADVYPLRMTSVTVDHAGTLYFTHATDSFITAVTKTGLQMSYDVMTSTPAAWPPQPSGLAADAHGSLWIADGANNRIVRMNVTTGFQTAVYTTSSPALSGPTGLALDRAGCLLVCDTLNHRIVKLDATTGVQVAVYTTSSPSLVWPTGVVLDSTGQHVLVSDTGNSRIVKLHAVTGEQVAVFTTPWPLLSRPYGVVLDAADALYIADSGNNRTVKLSASGLQLAVYTTDEPSLDRPCGVALDGDGALYIADLGNDRVVQMVPAEVVSYYTTTNPSLRNPRAVTTDATGGLVIVDVGNKRIVKLNSTGAETGAFLIGFVIDAGMYGVALDNEGNVLVPDNYDGSIVKYNSSTGAQLYSYTTRDPELGGVSGVAVDGDGFVYVGDSENGRIVKLNSSGELVAVYPTFSPAYGSGWLSVTVDSASNVYITNGSNSGTMKLSPSGELLTRYRLSGPRSQPVNVAVDAHFAVFVCDERNDRVVQFNTSGAEIAVWTTSNPTLRTPTGVHIDDAFGMFIVDHGNSRIVRFDLYHGRVEGASFEPCYSSVYSLLGLAVDDADDIIVADNYYNRIMRKHPAHAVVTIYTTSRPSLSGAWSVAVDSTNAIFIADAGNSRVVKLSANGTQVADFESPPLAYPAFIALDVDSCSLLVSDASNDRIVRLNATTGDQLAEYTVSNPSLREPYGVAVDSARDVLVADRGNRRIVRLSSSGEQLAVYSFESSSRLGLILFGVAVDSSNNIYVPDNEGGRVVKLNASGSVVASLSARDPPTYGPISVAVDSSGNVYYAESPRQRVTKLNSSGDVQDVLFTPRPLLWTPWGLAMSPTGHVLVACGTGQLMELSAAGELLDTYRSSTPSTAPTVYDVVVDAAGHVYMTASVRDEWVVVKMNSTTRAQMAVFNTSNPHLSRPTSVAVDSAGQHLFVADRGNRRVVKLSSANVLLAVYAESASPPMRPYGIALDSWNAVYVTDNANNRVLKLDFNLKLVAIFDSGPPSFVLLQFPRWITVDSSGFLWVSLEYSNVVKLNSTSGELVTMYSASQHLMFSPAGLVVSDSNELYVADAANHHIVRFVNPDCPSGHYCPFLTPITCPERHYCPPQHINAVASPTITPCPPGRLCPTGTDEPLLCPAAHYCPPMSVEPVPCPAAHYCYAGSDDPRGSHMNCNATGCSGICPRGSYCPYMSAAPLPCGAFLYGDEEGLVNASCSGRCSTGTWWNAPGQQSANCSGVCELGQYCPVNATQPLPCPGGSYCPTTTKLLSCRPGYYGASMGLTTATCTNACDAGFICTENSITPRQLPCPPGQHNNATGQSVCVECEPGTYAEASVNGTLACTLCPAGTSSSVYGASRCVGCLPGSYAADEGRAACLHCPAGQYSQLDSSDESDGLTRCQQCPIGQYSPTDGSSSCQYCSIGHYNNRTGQRQCTLCPPGTAAADEEEKRTGCSPCPLGQFSVSGKCEPCPRSTYSLLEGAQQCVSCSGIQGVDCEGGIAYIDKAYHGAVQVRRLVGDALEVVLMTQRCPDGYCVGVNSTVFSAAALSAYLQSIDDADDRPLLFALPQQCSSNRDQSSGSALCGGCQPGYAPPDVGSPQSGCVPCPGVSYRKVSMLIVTSWALVLVYYVASNGRLGLLSCLLYYLQTIAIMVSSQSSLTAWVRTFGFSPVTLMPAVCFGPMSPEAQYAIPLLIVPMQCVQLAVTVGVHWLLKRHTVRSSAYQLDERSMTYVKSVDEQEVVQLGDDESRRCRVDRAILQRLVMLIRYGLWPELTVSTVTRSLFLIVSASFTSVMVTCVSWFHCTDDSTIGTSRSSGSVVFDFPAVVCYRSSAYYGWSWLMGGLIALWLLVIMATTWWLWKHRKQLAVLQSRSALTGGNLVVAARPLALRPHVQDDINVTELYAPFLAHFHFAFYWPTPLATAHPGWDEPVCESGVNAVCMETRREYAFRSIYGALFDSFRADAVGWIVVVWLRRMLLIILSVVLTATPSAKYLSFNFLHLAIFCLQLYFQPFSTRRLNEAEQVSILVHLSISAVLTAFSAPTDSAVQSTVLTLTVAPLVSYVLYHQAHKYLRHTRRDHVRVLVRKPSAAALSMALLALDEERL